MSKFLLGMLAGVFGHSLYEVMAGPKLLKAKLDDWTSERDKEKYPALHRYWDSKSESENESEQ